MGSSFISSPTIFLLLSIVVVGIALESQLPRESGAVVVAAAAEDGELVLPPSNAPIANENESPLDVADSAPLNRVKRAAKKTKKKAAAQKKSDNKKKRQGKKKKQAKKARNKAARSKAKKKDAAANSDPTAAPQTPTAAHHQPGGGYGAQYQGGYNPYGHAHGAYGGNQYGGGWGNQYAPFGSSNSSTPPAASNHSANVLGSGIHPGATVSALGAFTADDQKLLESAIAQDPTTIVDKEAHVCLLLRKAAAVGDQQLTAQEKHHLAALFPAVRAELDAKINKAKPTQADVPHMNKLIELLEWWTKNNPVTAANQAEFTDNTNLLNDMKAKLPAAQQQRASGLGGGLSSASGGLTIKLKTAEKATLLEVLTGVESNTAAPPSPERKAEIEELRRRLNEGVPNGDEVTVQLKDAHQKAQLQQMASAAIDTIDSITPPLSEEEKQAKIKSFNDVIGTLKLTPDTVEREGVTTRSMHDANAPPHTAAAA